MSKVIPFPARAPRAPSPAQVRADLEAAAEAALDTAGHIIAVLDNLDGDPDREDDDPAEDGGDDEPSLGSPVGGDSQMAWAAGGTRDLEQALTQLGVACRAVSHQETSP